MAGAGRLHVDLPLAERRIVPVYVDAPGFKMINMKTGATWPTDKGRHGRAIVRLDRGAGGGSDRVTVRFEGELLLDWQSRGPHRRTAPVPGRARHSLFSRQDSYEIRAWQLRVFDGEATVLRPLPVNDRVFALIIQRRIAKRIPE